MQGITMQSVNDSRIACSSGRRDLKPQTNRIARQVVEQSVAVAFRVPLGELRARTRRNARIAFARQVAMYLAHVAYGFSLTDAGYLFRRDRTTVAHACRLVEDRRDDPVFDVFMDHLETAVVRLASALKTLGSS